MIDHTPGPWMCLVHDDGPRDSLVDIVQVADCGHVVAADVDIVNPADGRLLAAAPELLAALQDLVPRFRACILSAGSDPEYADAAVAEARRVLSKATRAP